MPKGSLRLVLPVTMAVLVAFFSYPSLYAQERGPSTAEERARAVKVAATLQTDPLSPETTRDREWLITWLIQIPDISVSMCSEVLGADLGDNDKGYRGALVAAQLASQAAFVIEHSDRTRDKEAQYLAGAEAALKAYEAIRMKDPKFRVKQLDDMVEKRNQGKLGELVRSASKKCK